MYVCVLVIQQNYLTRQLQGTRLQIKQIIITPVRSNENLFRTYYIERGNKIKIGLTYYSLSYIKTEIFFRLNC